MRSRQLWTRCRRDGSARQVPGARRLGLVRWETRQGLDVRPREMGTFADAGGVAIPTACGWLFRLLRNARRLGYQVRVIGAWARRLITCRTPSLVGASDLRWQLTCW